MSIKICWRFCHQKRSSLELLQSKWWRRWWNLFAEIKRIEWSQKIVFDSLEIGRTVSGPEIVFCFEIGPELMFGSFDFCPKPVFVTGAVSGPVFFTTVAVQSIPFGHFGLQTGNPFFLRLILMAIENYLKRFKLNLINIIDDRQFKVQK